MTLSATAVAARKPRRVLRRIFLTLAVLIVLSLLLLLAAAVWLRHAMHASLPQIDGNIAANR